MTDTFLNGSGAALPAHLQGTTDEEFGGGMDGGGYPRLAFKGSRFRLRTGDEELVLEQNTIEVIILKDYPHISRIFFDEGYDADGGGRPSCASADGEHPVSSIAHPQNNLCATCPQNEKGSAVTDDGKKSRACSFYKRLIVMIKGYEDVGPIVADIKAMSLFGDSNTGANWWSLKAYFQRLKSNGMSPFHLITKLTFDTDSSVPKVMFQPSEYVNEATFTEHVSPLIATPDGKQLLTDMSDTSSVRTTDDDEGGDQMALPAGEKPAHLTGPAEPEPKQIEAPKGGDTLQEQLEAAIAANDFGKAAEIQAQIQAPQPPAQEVDHAAEHQDQCDNLKVDIKMAVEAGDYAKAADLQALLQKTIAAFVEKHGTGLKAVPAKPAEPEEEKLSPQQKAARTRAKNKAKKEAALKAAAEGEVEDTSGGDDAAPFGSELDGALKDFGF